MMSNPVVALDRIRTRLEELSFEHVGSLQGAAYLNAVAIVDEEWPQPPEPEITSTSTPFLR